MCRAQLTQLKSLPAGCCSNVQMRRCRSSRAIRSERVVAEVEEEGVLLTELHAGLCAA